MAVALHPPTGESSLVAMQERPNGQLPVTTERKVSERDELHVEMLTLTGAVGVKLYQTLAPVLQGDD